ncbi:SGNH/GDSL hydrolase family protein [Brevundimonas sp. 2R-24]|uniref:SGNH/GDSL hydrolase family protein n=1 Tax=Peiella sedimenti TaxID=3061083 RepID=A0ABT8SKH9_9CAUL|nr:SGNH/GDSL hydrolase family protein [Caulobacteraceae bacterium XZ-24]
MKLKASISMAALGAALLMAGAVQAQSYDRVVVFGDSLSDVGNLPPANQPPSPPYFGGRFSNGQVWIERLGFTVGGATGVSGSRSFAFGGAWTANGGLTPTLAQQIAMYGGSGGTLGGGDLVILWGGANDIFGGVGPASVTANPFATISASAQVAAANMGAHINSVANAGAGTILVANLPNLGATPQFNSGPGLAAQGIVVQATSAFNAALFAQAQAQAAAHPNTNVIYMDVDRAYQTLLAAPSAFGLTNVSQACFNGVTVCTGADGYLFWDGVHPTAAGHALLAQVADGYLYYGDDGAQTTLQGETGLRRRSEALDDALDRLSTREFGPEGWALVFDLHHDMADYDARGPVFEAETETTGLTIAVEGRRASGMRYGVAFTTDDSDVQVGPVSFNAANVGFDVYGGWNSGSLFVDAAAGWSSDSYDGIERITALAPIVTEGRTEGSTLGAKVQAGFNMPMGGLTVSPRAGLSWVRTSVDGYSEQGPAVALHQYDDREISATSGEVAVRLTAGMGERASAVFDLGYRDSLSYDDDGVRVRIAGNTAQPITNMIEEAEGGQTFVGLAIEGEVAQGWTWSIGYRGRYADGMESQTARIGMGLRF